MTDSEFENITKIVLISISSLLVLFMVSFIVYHNTVINPDAERTFVDKTGWTINKGAFHKQVDCWGETIYSIGDKQIQYNQSWFTKDRKTVVHAGNLQEGVTYSTYEKYYYFLFVPDNYYIIESEDCGELK